MLYKDVVQDLQLQYNKLFKEALPFLNIESDSIEVIDHGLSNGQADEDFLDCGLGISVRVINQREGTQAGYTGKFLAWLPNQFMPEHWHSDILAVPKGNFISISYLASSVGESLTNLEEVVSDFNGVRGIGDKESYDFYIPDKSKRISINPRHIPHNVIFIPGKDEHFDIVYGDGSFFLPGEDTKAPTYDIPESQKPYVNHRSKTHLTSGKSLNIKASTPHSARAGPKGMVAIEYSMPSRDEADIFTNPNISRFTKILERQKQNTSKIAI